jgi:hypothetical protein
MNGMYGNYGGNMGMGMNDMSAMNYGGGYGGWNGMGGGYGNYNNGYNQMGGYNQSGAYPDMMNQYPKNNFPNQNQNRFPANQGGAYPQRNMRNGSHGSLGPGFPKSNSRPGSQNGPAPKVRRFHHIPQRPNTSAGRTPIYTATNKCVSLQRDGQSPDGSAPAASDAKTGDDQAEVSAESTEEGKANNKAIAESIDPEATQNGTSSGDASKTVGDATDPAGTVAKTTENSGLNPIQTFDSGDADMDDFNQPMMGNDMSYQQGMMNHGFNQSHMNPMYNSNMNMGYNNYGPRGGYNNGAYGAAKVLIDQPAEPIGVGVAGAPTGPRAMREGRPNTGFSSRINNARFVPPPKSVTSTLDVAPTSPNRRVRSYVLDRSTDEMRMTDSHRRSPQRDESMRVKNKSPSRSRSRSPAKDVVKDVYRERSRSADRESRREGRGRSITPKDEDDSERRKERLYHASSRHDQREEAYEERRRDDKKSRGDRTRTASVESKHRSSHREKDKHRSSRSHRDRSKEHRRRHRSRSRADDKYDDDEVYVNGEKESDSSSRRKHRSDKEKYRERSRDRESERDRKDRKEKDRDYDYDRSRDKDKDRKRRKDREPEEEERDYDDEKHRSSRRSRQDRDRDRSSRYDERDRDERDYKDDKTENKSVHKKEEDIVGAMMKKRAASPPLNAPTGPSANGFAIKGRSKNVMPPPVQPPTDPRALQPPKGPRALQPPKGPAADRHRDRSEPKDHHRKSSATSIPSGPATPKEITIQDHYAAERERNARERDSRDRVEKPTKSSLHSRIASRPSLSSKREHDDIDEPEPPRGPKADAKPPSGPSSHRDKRRKSGTTGDDNIARLFTAGLRKNAKARRGGVRTEGDEGRELERVERERERR